MARTQPLAHRNEHPEYAELAASIGGLQATAAQLRSRMQEIEILLRTAAPAEDRVAGHVEAAQKFVETGVVHRSENSDSWREDHLRLREQLEAVQQAIDTKQRALYALESRLSSEALAGAKDDFAEIRTRYVAKLRELDAIAVEEQQLLNSLNAKGYYPSINPVAWPLIGVLSDPQSAISSHVRELGRR